MQSSERDPGFADWVKERGITVPLAPVVVQAYSPHSSVAASEQNEWDLIFRPFYTQTTWLTTELGSTGDLPNHRLVSIISEDGRYGATGFAVPNPGSEGEPFYFRWSGLHDAPEISIVEGISVARFAPDPLARDADLTVFVLSHPFLSDQVPREGYAVLYAKDNNASRLVRRHIAPASLISGREGGRVLNRMGTWWQPKVPFEYLLGLSQPGLWKKQPDGSGE
ncbi:MAG: hypothetical protein A2900_05295 [Candidatus Chisholmbacteria bacterium RIFCSPLOWO2_01_FULL_50_28]|uniref:Uncharacterized protein n=1 Tax=Candidatus Chisholmbacteria bacterium RIFCSPHIGHO2_01_FULL_52_32 TaxID=1797591 RepID=A0A1G1VS68_9BACT|nr:MAG: hypothetical protein A2786_01450 [Candidatus Chisholmbacteria bacterium RIFCSPHIGHO2_01_FULL_52_32]OGY20463.1 MAG: hypothetical protein A2900_05295 [Candidatus Chisholmbacteria bacterium RIFCSPLOWO2_01_FULL_50_28]